MPYTNSLCLIVIVSLVTNLQAATLQIDKAPTPAFVLEARSAKTFRIVVQQSFKEAPKVRLPFGETIRALLKSTNLREVNDDADITIVVKAVGGALGAHYNGGFRYTGAELSGSLRVNVRSGLYCEASINSRIGPPMILTIMGPVSESSPSNAPFQETFAEFATKLCNIVLDLFGVPPLLSVLKDKNEDVRIGVVKILGSTSDPAALGVLITSLGDDSYRVNLAAAEILKKMPDARVTEALVKSLKSPSIDVRTWAAKILSERKDCCPVEPLLAAFDDRRNRTPYEVNPIRSELALALGATKNPLALRRLVLAAARKSESPDVRSSVAEALGKFQDPAAADALIAIIESTREDASVRSSALRSVGLTGDPRAVPVLIRKLMDPDYGVRENAAFALGFFREARVVEALLMAMSQKKGESYSSRARDSLEKLTGQKLYDEVAWQKWWQDNKNTFEQQQKQ
jgi:HEAT repeat protein